MVNFRDLGGLAAGAGRYTNHGVLYRADAPHPDGAAPPGLVGWPPALVLDLRGGSAGLDGHPLVGRTTRVAQIPLLAAGPFGNWRAFASLTQMYLSSLLLAGERIAEVFDLLTSAGAAGPTLVHCAAGKDRTGVLIAVLLRAAGVPRDVVLEDYLRTEHNVPALLQRFAWDMSVLDEQERERAQYIVGTSASALLAVLDELDTCPGGVAGWLCARRVPGAAIEAWATRLVRRVTG